MRPMSNVAFAADPNLDEALVPWPRSHGAGTTVYLAAVGDSLGARTWRGST